MQSILPDQFTENTIEQNTKEIRKTLKHIHFDAIIDYLLITVVFLLPLLVTPFSSEVFYSYRSILVALLAGLLVIAWGLKGFTGKYIYIAGIRNTLSVITLLIITLLGVIYSLNPTLSFYGGFFNLDQPAYYFFALIIISYVVINSKIDYKKIVLSFIASITLSSVFTLIGLIQSMVGKTLIQFIATSDYNLYGTLDKLLALEIIAGTASLYLLFIELNRSKSLNFIKIIYILAILINVSVVLISGHTIYSIILLILAIISIYTNIKNTKSYLSYLLPIIIIFISISIVSFSPQLRSAANIPSMSLEPRLNFLDSWTISASVLKDKPFFGTGLGNYMKAFAMYRPVSLNTTFFWRHDIISPYNDFFMAIDVFGVIGMVSYILSVLMIGYAAYKKLKSNKTNELAAILSIGLLLISVFTGLNFNLYLITAITFGYLLTAESRKIYMIKGYILPIILIICGVGIFTFICKIGYDRLVSEYYYKLSSRQSNLSDSAKYLEKAMARNPKEPSFVIDYILLSKTAASNLSKKEGLNNTDLNNIATFVNYSLKYAEYLTNSVDSTNHAYWDLRGNLYFDIMPLDKNASEFALNAFGQAITYKPLAADILYKAGVVYFQTGRYKESADIFKRSITIKPNYAAAIYGLALSLEKQSYIEDSILLLESLKTILPAEATNDQKIVENDLNRLYIAKEDAIQKIKDSNVKDQSNAPVISDIKSNPGDKIQNPGDKSKTAIEKGSVQEPLAGPNDKINVDFPVETNSNP